MDVYVAYFDILGFKDFIECNPKAHVDRYFSHVFRESQSALTNGQLVKSGGGAVPNMNLARVNCMHISDSILFWTNDLSTQAFNDISNVCYQFFWRSMQASFPVRGCLVAGDMEFQPFQISNNPNGIVFINSSMYGAGIIDAYLKAESQDWAGAYIDNSAIQTVTQTDIDALVAAGNVRYFDVPLTKGRPSTRELCFCIIQPGFNQKTFTNMSQSINSTFNRHAAGNPLAQPVQHKLNNTISYLDFLRIDPQTGKQP